MITGPPQIALTKIILYGNLRFEARATQPLGGASIASTTTSLLPRGPVQLARTRNWRQSEQLLRGIAVAYLGPGRFDPAKEALAPDSSNKLRPTNASAKRPTYEDQLNSFMAHLNIVSPSKVPPLSETVKGKMWSRLQAGAEPGLDSSH
jgi:hypothetical protein